MSSQVPPDPATAFAEKIRELPPAKIAEVEGFVDFLMLRSRAEDRLVWAAAKASEPCFARVWDNPADAAYDKL